MHIEFDDYNFYLRLTSKGGLRAEQGLLVSAAYASEWLLCVCRERGASKLWIAAGI